MLHRALTVLAAPSNLGLRPPEPGSVPGVVKAPEALREAGLHAGLVSRGANEAGVVLSGRYRDDWRPGSGRIRNQEALLEHAASLAARLAGLLDDRAWPLVLGGDCSILIGIGVALKQRGRFGLIHLDGHTDFRNPGNSDDCASLAGEDLAAVTGKHWPQISDVAGLGPYFDPADAVHAGCRDDDAELDEVRCHLAGLFTSAQIRQSPSAVAAGLLNSLPSGLDGVWLQLDVDILDPEIMPAVDAPDPDGIDWAELEALLAVLLPRVSGMSLTVFDPDLDPDGSLARRLSSMLLSLLADES
ncbi:MAG: arginase family protein [Renibacterium salmoninarum]|nr:arginase family protein [Renibacterium salmoninarum]